MDDGVLPITETYGWPEPSAAIAETTDLRSVTWPGWMTPHDQHQAYAVLVMEPGTIDLQQFVEEAELGPLASVQVYSTDALGRYQGKSHGIGCVHHEELRPDDEIVNVWTQEIFN